MLGENIKQLRKQKGITQEELAIRLHVVRQTVSKWEKNLSVPDAEMLQKISEALDTSVNELLGADIKPEPERNEVAEQLSRINEQLAIKNRRSRRIWTVIAIVFAALVILTVVTMILGVVSYKSYKPKTTSMYTTMSEDPVYSEEEVNEAFDVVMKYFNRNFKRCTLNSLSYDEEESLQDSAEWAKQYGADEAIVLTSSFTTDNKGGDGSLEPNNTYHDWQWILTRTSGGPWTLQTDRLIGSCTD